MKSVLVLGDIRTHTINCRCEKLREPHDAYLLYGGAFFMRHTIQQALTMGAAGAIPDIFSYQQPSTDQRLGAGRKWTLSSYGDKATAVYRLRFEGLMPRRGWPQLDKGLKKALGQDGRFLSDVRFAEWEKTSQDKTLLQLPDIMVFDDLGESLRHIEIEDGAVDYHADPNDLQTAVKVLFARLRKRLQNKEHQKLLSPIIVISLMDDLDSLLNRRRLGQPTRFWSKLLDEPGLPARIVLLLDADDLRKVTGSESVPVFLGSELSRTLFLSFGGLIFCAHCFDAAIL